ncbi:XRE family transcriptional regulator [Verminephrobacter aporrectodeae]|uniref:XRE family transcriptional regulator n=1 Tax=Verminephrobacter aporrectodeae TaxID=1110389 RepID=UPI0022447023|nr:XRE family transcriptional regulator [Verminephrobacter aporrectodeae]MCW8177546.1 ImmA/IrrE family metallo-endopeptidase [Verminephrobacter aporrectodeae subsp. tuberculatae]MCW8204983.1 ImmA/IrrE family metallo-endopeptidase [Verminephrobacter aporrectodeae subsp. tuberculatae]MCW8206827.1 ImmA/IrrE family metallo-endopeptidase [Verminephrobacter aporrectodeae subsp. tuberculatae]
MSRRGGIQGFQKDRLSQILAARRLTQVQLASIVEVSPTTISKWRAGTQAPERDALERLAEVARVTPEWFTRVPAPKMSLPLFRSNAFAHVAARAMLEARLEWAQDVAAALMEYVDYPDVNVPTRTYTDPEEITSEDIEKAACECRDMWRLGRSAIQDLALAVEGAGIILVREETGIAQIEGLSAWSVVLDRPLVLLSADKDNGYRSRFDLAHEIGHLVLHRYIKDPTERTRHKVLEQQAHRFAGAFLLPAKTFATEVRVPPTLDDLLLLKRRWGVSAAAIIMRLRALELLDGNGALMLFKRRSARWGAKSEPGDGDRKPEQPRLLRRTIDLLVEEKVMPLEAIPRHIGLAAMDIETLAGLPKGYFLGKTNVVEFARLKATQKPSSDDRPGQGNKVIQFRPLSKS